MRGRYESGDSPHEYQQVRGGSKPESEANLVKFSHITPEISVILLTLVCEHSISVENRG